MRYRECPNILPIMSSTDILLLEIETFLTRTGMKAVDFGREAVSDGAFVYRLRRGSDCRLKTADRVRAYMMQKRPAESGKPRPKFRPSQAA